MTRAVRVDHEGVHLPDQIDGAVDVCFGDHRVWSFSTAADGRSSDRGVVVPWPERLAARLNGLAEVSIRPHLGGDPLFNQEVRFGASTIQLQVVDELGNRLSIDKNGRLQRSFDRMDDASRRELVAASRELAADLVDKCGLDVYLAYGCLLGAVRDGHMIGHDSDIDLAFLSKYEHPFDVIREARRAERKIRELGWDVVRFSAANFKIRVPLPSGKAAGVDVFGSFYVGDHLNVTGNLRGTFPREGMRPFGTIELEGVEFPAPRLAEDFLAFTYGPGWRTPDPAWHFDFPARNKQIMNQWLRTPRFMFWHWKPFYSSAKAAGVPSGPSSFATWVEQRVDSGSRIIELGSGTGRDALSFAEHGHRVLGSDYVGSARGFAQRAAAKRNLNVRFAPINLNAHHSWLVHAAELAHEDGPKHVYARMLLESMTPDARPNLWRFCSMVCRSGGHTFLEFRTAANRGSGYGTHLRLYPRPDVVASEIASFGGTMLHREESAGLAQLGEEDPVVCRMEVSWQ